MSRGVGERWATRNDLFSWMPFQTRVAQAVGRNHGIRITRFRVDWFTAQTRFGDLFGLAGNEGRRGWTWLGFPSAIEVDAIDLCRTEVANGQGLPILCPSQPSAYGQGPDRLEICARNLLKVSSS